MSLTKLEDKRRQEDEAVAIQNIYNPKNCLIFFKDKKHYLYNIFLDISKEKLKVRYMNVNDKGLSNNYSHFFIEYLPPIRLIITLPEDYPSYKPPEFSLIISWLPPWEISFICQKLDEIWSENRGNEILFLWIEFFKNDLFDFLKIQHSLDVSFLYMIHIFPFDYIKFNWQTISDDRVLNRGLFLNPIRFLTKYSMIQHKINFPKKYYTCNICFETVKGQKCTEVNNCGHICCNDCIHTYISTKIDSGLVRNIYCPQFNCTTEINYNQIKEICSDKFEKYEDVLLKKTLNMMNDLIYCPRKMCQYPVIKDSEQETLARCTNCGYNFCVYCHKVYHGVSPCTMSLTESLKLIEEYQSGDNCTKKLLQIKYGRRQIQAIIEEHLTKEYLKNYTKYCPHCHSPVMKIDGCNKMTCTHCQTSFCWLCGDRIFTQNPYDHFIQSGNKCYRRLFEGMIEEEEMHLGLGLDY